MSKHVSRGERWSRQDSRTYVSELGKVVFLKGAWYALLEYRTLVPAEQEGAMPTWQAESRRLGPCRRPRNAMIELDARPPSPPYARSEHPHRRSGCPGARNALTERGRRRRRQQLLSMVFLSLKHQTSRTVLPRLLTTCSGLSRSAAAAEAGIPRHRL